MQRSKRALVWLTIAALVVTLMPFGFAQKASAASTYFIPDIASLNNTAQRVTDSALATADNPLISRENVYSTTTGTLTITGTFSYVTSTSMSVKVEMLTAKTDTTVSPARTYYATDSAHSVTSTVTADASASNRFTASNLPLFAGFNKITFTGMQGNVERSDTFYVLYDSVPYVESIKVMGSSAGTIVLNEGTQVVVDRKNVSIQGSVKNATSVSYTLNGGSSIVASLVANGTFYTPTLDLVPGENTISFKVSNGADSINVTRMIYFFDPNQPFSKVNLKQDVTGAAEYSLLNNNSPALTDSTQNTTLSLQMIVPYNATPFPGNATYNINNAGATTIATATETEIPGVDGVTSAYKLVTFELPHTITTDANQTLRLVIGYNGASYTFEGKFRYLPGNTVIKEMFYLPDYNPSTNTVNTASKVPLNGSQVAGASFYILVRSETDPGANALQGVYLPLGTSPLTLNPVADSTAAATERVYEVTGFASGIQQVKFNYNGSTAAYNATITYASKSYIYVENLYDGQTYTFNSRDSDNELNIKGQYIGFDNLASAQYFVNGKEMTNDNNAGGDNTNLNVSASNLSFNLEIDIKNEGPLVYGQNTILFTGVTLDASGYRQEVTKQLKIYIIDENVSTISDFHPTSGDDRAAFPSVNPSDFTDEVLTRIFALSNEFVYSNEQYMTSRTSYDLVLRGSGASKLNLNFGSTSTFLSLNLDTLPTQVTSQITSPIDGATLTYDYANNGNEFIIRLRDLSFADPGTHTYNLELINSTGARTTQRVQITREASSFRVLAPQPTVGNQIVVNKNFVHFDIEADGATQVLVDGNEATRRTDFEDRFVYDFIGLKENKNNAISVEIVRDGTTITETVNVFYTGTVQIDAQYLAPLSTKHTVFNKELSLTFPKGTVMKSAAQDASGVTKYYTDAKLLFGIADPADGVVERRNDYGNIINRDPNGGSQNGNTTVKIEDYLKFRFLSTANTSNFTLVSDIYWINGGLGEDATNPATQGLPPYSIPMAGNEQINFPEDFQGTRKIVPSNRGELTLTYDSNVVDDAGSTITVFAYTNDGEWRNIGGEVDTKNNTITVPFDDFGYYKVMKLNRGFSDITNHSWARNVLNALYAKGIMTNLRVSEFGSDDLTTRGEFATLLVKGLNIPLNYDDNQSFFDVVPTAASGVWDYASIETAARAGIVNGVSEGYFDPDGNLTREQAAVMIARALELKLAANDSKLEASLAKSFLDSSNIQYYARPAVSAVNAAKIMSGSPVTVPGATKASYNFNPKLPMTRAEAGKIAVALLQRSTSMFPKNLS